MTLRTLLTAALAALPLAACTPDAPAVEREAARAAGAAHAPAPPTAERSTRRVVLFGVDLTGVGYDLGSPTAPIVVVDFSDFGCPYCARHALETMPELAREFVAAGQVFYKYVPFVMGMFPNGDLAARASECAADQGRFWPMHDRIYEGQREWKGAGEPAALFARYAAELGLNGARFGACMEDGRTEERTARASDAARQLRVRATPTFVVDGERVEGALPLDVFQRVLRAKVQGAR